MKDRYIVYSDGRRCAVSDLTDAEVQRFLDKIDYMHPVEGSATTRDEMRDRLRIEQRARRLL